jgi:ubiquinol oxidase
VDDAPATSGGPVSAAVSRRPPLGPMERLPHDRLVAEQRTTLGLSRRRYSLSARALFTIMDRLYGEPRTLEKFRVLELVARVPYQAWENVAYVRSPTRHASRGSPGGCSTGCAPPGGSRTTSSGTC